MWSVSLGKNLDCCYRPTCCLPHKLVEIINKLLQLKKYPPFHTQTFRSKSAYSTEISQLFKVIKKEKFRRFYGSIHDGSFRLIYEYPSGYIILISITLNETVHKSVSPLTSLIQMKLKNKFIKILCVD